MGSSYLHCVGEIAVVALLLAVRIRHLSAGGSPKDFGTPNDESLLWRLYRAQSNLAENLPLYIGVLFLLTVRGVSGTAVDSLVVLYIISFACAYSDSHSWAKSDVPAHKLSYSVSLLGRFDCFGNLLVEKELLVTAHQLHTSASQQRGSNPLEVLCSH